MTNHLGVAIPTYNRSILLDKLLSSIPGDIPVSVSDNGSFTDESVKQKFKNATFISHDNVIDVFENWNIAAKNSNAEWILIPSDDDIFYEGAFYTVRNYITKYPNADMLIFGHELIDGDGVNRKGWSPKHEMEYTAPLGFEIFKYGVDARMPSIVFKASSLKRLEYFDEYYKLTSGDSDLIQRMLLTGTTVFIPKIISAYRVWEGALTSKKIATKLWLDEILYWQVKVLKLAKIQYTKANIPNLSYSHIKDEVYARNLIGGVRSKRASEGITSAIRFFRGNPFPWRANFRTKLQLVKKILINEK